MLRPLRQRACLAVLALSTLTFTGAPRAAELVDAIVATVGTEVILRSELLRELESVRRLLEGSNMTQAALQAEFQRELEAKLDDAIESKILYREAKKIGVEISDDVLDDEIKKLSSGYDTDEEFINALREYGETISDFRERTRKRIMAARMSYSKRADLDRKVVVSEDEILDYFDEHQADFVRPTRVHFRQIMINSRRGSQDRKDAVTQLEALRVQLAEGADFGTLAKEYSNAVGAEQGGIVGWAVPGEFVGELEDALFDMEVGDVSRVIETQFGALIVQVDDKEEESTPSPNDIRAQIEPLLHDELVQERYDKWIQDLRRRNRVRVFM